MLGRRTLFLMLFHFFHLTLSVPNPANLLPREKPPGSTECYDPSAQTAMIPDVAACIEIAKSSEVFAYSDTGCRSIATLNTAEIGICGAFEKSGEEVYSRMIQIEFGCSEWHTNFNGPTGGIWRDDDEPDWYLYINGL